MTKPPIWKWDLKKHKRFKGVYIGAFPGIGKFRRTQRWFKRSKDGKTWAIWDTWQIAQRIQFIRAGSSVSFNFLGKKKDKKHKFGVMNFKISVKQTK